MWSRYLDVTDRRTDGQACNLITALSVASRSKNSTWKNLESLHLWNEFLTCLNFIPAASEIYVFDGESTKIRLLTVLIWVEQGVEFCHCVATDSVSLMSPETNRNLLEFVASSSTCWKQSRDNEVLWDWLWYMECDALGSKVTCERIAGCIERKGYKTGAT